MKQLTRTIATGIALAACLLCSAETVNVVTVHKVSGDPVHFLVSESPKTYFTNSDVEVKSGTGDTEKTLLTVSLDNFASLTLGTTDRTNATTNIGDIFKGEPVFQVTDVALQSAGLRANSEIVIYDVAGVLHARATVDANGEATISLQGLPAGVYVVATESTNFKFVKR